MWFDKISVSGWCWSSPLAPDLVCFDFLPLFIYSVFCFVLYSIDYFSFFFLYNILFFTRKIELTFRALFILTKHVNNIFFRDKWDKAWLGIIHSVTTKDFPKNYHFLLPDTRTYVYVSGVSIRGVRNVSFLENSVYVPDEWFHMSSKNGILVLPHALSNDCIRFVYLL